MQFIVYRLRQTEVITAALLNLPVATYLCGVIIFISGVIVLHGGRRRRFPNPIIFSLKDLSKGSTLFRNYLSLLVLTLRRISSLEATLCTRKL